MRRDLRIGNFFKRIILVFMTIYGVVSMLSIFLFFIKFYIFL